jgi:hypothetical protein
MSRGGLSAVITTSTTPVRHQIFNFDNSIDYSLLDLALRPLTCFETNQTTGDAPTEAPYVPLRNRYPVFLSVGFHPVSNLTHERSTLILQLISDAFSTILDCHYQLQVNQDRRHLDEVLRKDDVGEDAGTDSSREDDNTSSKQREWRNRSTALLYYDTSAIHAY